MERLKIYAFSLIVAAVVFTAIGLTQPVDVLVEGIVLAILEVSFSFDNAIVNASVLERMSRKWQFIFMTLGMVIAVGVVRFLLPIIVVMATADKDFGSVVNMALNEPARYSIELESAHVPIAVVSGIFLLMIYLAFMIVSDREVMWIKPFERPLAKLSKFTGLATAIAVVVIVVIAATTEWIPVLVAGFVTLAVFLFMAWLGNRLESNDEEESDGVIDGKSTKRATGMAGFGLFMYLEFQDAAFSFDGVSGAFAITSNVVIIAACLGIGSLFVRSMTIDLLRSGKLAEFRFLEHGAHWAIGVLAVCILASIYVEIPSYVTGLIGVAFIVAAVIHSRRLNKLEASLPPVATEVSEAH